MADQDNKATPAENSKLRENEPTRKKQKLGPPTFSDPASIVTFIVGKGKAKFTIHKDNACHYSPVLSAAFNSEFIEGQTQTYILEDTTPSAFRLLQQWLYKQSFETLCRDEARTNFTTAETDENASLAELWVLADKLDLPQLADMALFTINKLNSAGEYRPIKSLKYVYRHTSTDSLLRRYFLTSCAKTLSHSEYEEDQDLFPTKFWFDLAMLLTDVAPNGSLKRRIKLNVKDFYMVKPETKTRGPRRED